MSIAGAVTTGQTKTSETAALARAIADFDLDAVPDDVIALVKNCILDSIGCIVGGAASRPCRMIANVLMRHGGEGDVIVPGSGHKLRLLDAAYLNAQAANALDFDDSFRDGAPSHPGATIVPPALALAQQLGADGRALLRAVILGYEVSLRVGRAVQPSPQRKAQVYGFSNWQIFGAAAASSSLLALSGAQNLDLLGLAAAHAPVPSLRKLGTDDPRPFPWIKNTYGIASQTGLLSALLAAEGYVGSRNVFDGPRGFWVMSGSDRYRPELLVEDWGNTWFLCGVGFKPYGCCRWTHTMLDGLGALRRDLDVSTISNVIVEGFEELSRLGGDAPTSIVDAQFHAPHLAALELLGRTPQHGLREVDLHDPAVIALRQKVELRHDQQADTLYYKTGQLPVRVTVCTENGVTRTIALENPRGSALAGGLSRHELTAKFLALTTPALGSQRAERVIDAIGDIENIAVHTLAELLA